MKAFLAKHVTKFRFMIVGSANTLIDFGLLFILVSAGLDKIPSNYISTTIAFIFSFSANRSFTFKSKGDVKRQIILFLIVTLFGLWVIQPIIIAGAGYVLASFTQDSSVILFISKLFATGVTLIWNYILYARVVYKT